MTPTKNPILTVLALFNQAMETLISIICAKGWNLSRPQLMVIMAIESGITRPSQIAAAIGITRQAVHQTIAELIAGDLIETAPDEKDRRAKVVRFTSGGERLAADIAHGMKRVTTDIESPLKFGAAA